MRTLIAILSLFVASSVAGADLVLERIGPVTEARAYPFVNPSTGGSDYPFSCDLQGTVVTLNLKNGTLDVTRQGTTKTIAIDKNRMISRSTLACGDADRFFYAAPRTGRLYAYSADAVMSGKEPLLWDRTVAPFRGIDEAGGDMANAGALAVVQTRQNMVLAEWYVRRDGVAESWQRVFDASGNVIGTIGPTDLMLKTAADDPWWILLQGGGGNIANYVPQNICRLSVGTAVKPVADVLAELRAGAKPSRQGPVTTLSDDPILNHLVSFLTPDRTATSNAIAFCPTVPPERARYWLGDSYNSDAAGLANAILQAYWAEHQEAAHGGNPIDQWFQAEIAPREPMKSVLANFNPDDDQWVGRYQRALLQRGRPVFDRWLERYGRQGVEIIREK